MKRDMELVREILLILEESKDFRDEFNPPEGRSRSEVAYHLNIMEEAGLVKQNVQYAGDEPLWMQASITWDGQEFLDSVKNETVWSKVKKKMKEECGQIPFAIIKTLAIKYAEQQCF